MLLSKLRTPFCQLGFESRPRRLIVAVVLALEQSEGFFGTQLRYAGEVPNSETVENLCAGQFARAGAERAFDALGRFVLCGHVFSSLPEWERVETAGGVVSRGYFLGLINRPGSLVSMETILPLPSRVV